MALTDAQAKIIAQNKKKREEEQKIAAAAAAKILASSTTKKSPSTILDQRASSRPYSPMLTQQVYRPSGTLKTPLNYLQEAAAQKITTQDRISAAKRSGAVRGDYQSQWQKNKATATERLADRRERNSKQTLSEYDSKLDRTAQDRIRSYKTQYGLAREAGDAEGMKTAHALAEQVRARAGYSGGVTGDEFLTADLTDQEKLLLNPVGQNKMKMAKLAQKQAFEAKDAKALQEATEEMARIMSAPGYRNQAAVDDTDAHGRSKMPGSPDAQKDAEQALAILKAAGYGTAGAFAALMESSRKALNSRDPWGVKAAKDKALENLADYDLMDSDDPQKQQWGRELAGYRKQKEQEELQTWMDDLNAKRLEYLGESYASGLMTWEDYQQRREELLRETMTDAQWLMYQSQNNLAKAAEGQSMAGQFGTNTLVSGLQQLPGMAAALIPVVGPAVSLAYLGAMAAGQKAYELDQRGIEPGEVFTRSFLSAGVEVLTEKIPLDAMLDIVKKGGGENFLKALGKTLGLNFTEESLAYTGNWLLDKAYEDPEAKFSLAEMAANGLAGALIGGTAAVGGAAVMGRGTMERGTPGRFPAPSSVTPDGAPPSPQGEGLGVRESLPTAEEAVRQQRAVQAETELERSGILAGAEEETIRRVGDLAGKLNREVRFFRGESWENGRYDPNTGILHLNTNGRNPIMQVFAHELTHSIETAESYDKLAGVILETMDDTELNERFQEITQRYQEKGVFLEDPAEVMNEVVAEYVETRLLTDYEAISSLVQTDRSLGQRILEWIDSMLAKLGSTAAQERAALTEARELYARALQETNKGGGTMERETPMVPPQTPSGGLPRAPQKEASEPGVGNRRGVTGAHTQTEGTIPQSASQTAPFAQGSLLEESASQGEKGWEDLPHDPYMEALGEQLRSGEISEEEFDRRFDEYYHGGSEVFDYDTEETTLPMKYSFAGRKAKTADLDALRKAQKMDAMGVAGETIRRDTGWFRGADGKWRFEIDDSGMKYIPREEGTAPGQTLASFLEHDELFQSYPHLRETKLEFADLGAGVRGQYNSNTDTITLAQELRGEPESTLIHEIQHAIQKAEGFARGASREFWEGQLQNGYDGKTQQQRREVQRLWQEYNGIRDNEPDFFAAMVGLEAMTPDVPRGKVDWDTLEQIEEDPVEWQRYDAARERLEQQYGDEKVWDFSNLRYKLKQAEMNAGRSATDLYYDTAGEIEARDTANRKDLTAGQRRETPPDTGNEDTVFVENSGGQKIQYSIARTEDGSAVAVVDSDILSHMDTTQWDNTKKAQAKAAAKTALLAFQDGIQVNGITYKVNKKSRDEYTRSRDTERKYYRAPGAFADKMRAAANADDIITATTAWKADGELRHSRMDNFVDFVHGDVLIQAGVNKYKAETVVGITSEGEYVFYDVVDMEPARFEIKEESSLTAASDRDAVSAIQEDSSGFSIPDGGQKVQYSIARMEGTKGDYRPGVMIDKKRNPGKHTATDESQRFRYQKPRTGDTQSGISTEPSIPNDGRNVKRSISGEGESQPGRTWTRETLPAKARDQLDRTERAMVNRLGKAMDVPVKARQTSLREIARELGETYLATGRIDQETADRLFETAWEKGVVEDREYYDQYKPIKDRLRTLPLRISEEDSHDIVDYAHFKKAARGVLRLVKDEGTPVDVAYEEMKQTAPELFPAEITHPADQLVQMYEVARGIQKTEKSLADHYGPEAETYKAFAKNDFCEQVYDAVADWKLVRRYADDRAEELEQNAGQVVLVTPEQVKEAWKGLKEDRKAYEKVMAKTLLTDHDKVQVGRLLKGELEPEHLEPGKDNVKGILEVWKAREAYERDRRAIAEWNKGRKDQLRAEADGLLATANSWKDKKMGLQYAAETMERNIRDIVPDKDLAEEIIQTYFAPVHTAQAESTRLKNRMRQRVKELDLSRKVKNGNLVSEAHAVQLYGEAMDNIQMLKNSRGRMKHRDGKTLQEWEAVVTKLWEENPNLDKGKIQRAVEEFRKIYDDLFEQMNEARIRNGYEPTNYRKGYFPHFQPGHTDGITGMFANVLGISTEITALPTTIAGMTHTFKPGIRWFGNAQERLGFNTAYDAVEGFDKYIEGVADVICQTDNIQRLRALASQTRYRTSDEGIRKQVDAVLANESLSEQDKENRIRDIYENGRFALSNFVINLDEYTNLLANKRSLHDRSMEQDFGRKAYNLVRWLEGRVGANMVAINPGSWLTNLIPLTQGGAQLGSGQLMKGMWETLQAYAGKSSQDFVDRSTFLTNRRGSDPLVPRWAELADTNTKPKQILRKAGEVTGKAGDFLAMGMEYIDKFTADTLVRARYNQNLKRGLSEEAALEEADAWTAGVMADRSKGATPTLFSRTNPGTKLFTQFQLEVNNQLRYLFKDIPRQEAQRGAAFVAGTILKFFLGAWLYDEVYEYFLGRRPAMDPIGILNDTVGDLTGWELPNLVELGVGAVKGEVPSFQTEKPGTYEAITGAAKEVAGQIPFVGGLLGGGRLPVSNAIPDAGNLLKAATNDDWSAKKRWDTVAKELWKPLSYVALPTGGGQIKKVIQGANAVRKGGSYTVDAEGNEILQYPVYGDTPWEMVKSLGQATVFGKTTLPTGKDWVERNFQNLSARETAAYRELTEEMDSDSRTVYETLRAMKAEKDDSGKRSVLSEADLTDREMQVIYNYLFGEKQPEGGYISSRDEDITALAEVGVGMDEFLTIQNQYAAINKMDGNAEAKATAFARWLNTQGYSQEESAAIQGAFRYYYQMPADAARYNEMTALDLDDETAAGIADSLGALEPLDGATQVSNAQKYRVVVDAGISEDKQMEVLGSMMQEAEYTRLQVGRQHGGVAPTEYVQFLEMKPLYDEDGNGSFKQAEVTALLKAMNISNSSKAALWQMANKSWKPGKNPFSVDVGAKVYEGLNGG